MNKNIIANVEIRTTPIANVEKAYSFHIQNLNEYLLPRAEERFFEMIKEREVFEAFDHISNNIVGICYITKDKELCGSTSRAEFGGVFVSRDFRQSDLGFALAAFAISKFSLDNPTDLDRLIAHVHQYNRSPLRLMKRLGFRCFGAEIPPLFVVEKMKKNKKGYVIGFLFVFLKRFYLDFGDFFESLESQKFEIRLKGGSISKITFDFYEGIEWLNFTQAVVGFTKDSNFRLLHNCRVCNQKSLLAWVKSFYT